MKTQKQKADEETNVFGNASKDELPQKEISEYILKRLSKKADDVVLTTVNANKTQIKFVNNKISNITNWNATSIDVFLSSKKRLVTTTMKAFTKEDVDKAIDTLMKFVKNTKPNKEYRGIAKGPFKYQEIEETYDKGFLTIGEKGIDYVEAGINESLKHGAKRVSGVLETTTSNVNLKTNYNIDVDEKGTSLYYSVRSLVDKYASGHQTACARMLKNFSPENAASESAEIAKMSQNPEQGKLGKFDILFAPMPFSNILDHVGQAASIFNVESGLSCLGGKMNKKIGSEKVTLIDDGRLKNGFHSSMFDAEGMPTQRTTIIENGKLKSYLHNTTTAKKYKTKSTGNAGIITPSPNNLIFSTGNQSDEEMISGIKKGIYVTNVWYTRFQNYSTGDFSTIPRDGCFYIENGKIKNPIKGIRISDNLLNVMKMVDSLGKTPQQVYCWEIDTPVTTPKVLVKGLNITKPNTA
ncbi:MAG: TldD/PmbA family protein [Nanoarchaeota archaeon]|nr:TldD/PmbA family protein [Nanoarchaeota archaeon]